MDMLLSRIPPVADIPLPCYNRLSSWIPSAREYKEERLLNPLETAHAIVDLISAKMGSDVLLLDLSKITIIADYFAIATANSQRQLKALAQDTQDEMKKQYGVRPLSVEGSAESGWILLDYGAVVVHIFTERQRDYYRLEELWSDARTVVRIA